jgi:hypothetical protein
MISPYFATTAPSIAINEPAMMVVFQVDIEFSV